MGVQVDFGHVQHGNNLEPQNFATQSIYYSEIQLNDFTHATRNGTRATQRHKTESNSRNELK